MDPASASAIERIEQSATLLWAPRGVLDQSPGLYPAEQIERATEALPHLSAQLIADTNHLTIAVGESGARAIATAMIARGPGARS